MLSRRTGLLLAILALPMSAAAADLPGSWTAQVGGNEYLLIFDDQGGLSVAENDEAVVVAEYEAGGGELTIRDLGGAKACQGDAAEGTYRYDLSGGTLSLESVQDPCNKRAAVLDGTEFQSAG